MADRGRGFEAAIDYKSESVKARLKELCPKGIDIFFDNVGGEVLDSALAALAMRGRVVLCGAIANYNATEPPPGPKNYLNLLVRRGRMEGFIVIDYMPRAAEAVGALWGWVQGRQDQIPGRRPTRARKRPGDAPAAVRGPQRGQAALARRRIEARQSFAPSPRDEVTYVCPQRKIVR